MLNPTVKRICPVEEKSDTLHLICGKTAQSDRGKTNGMTCSQFILLLPGIVVSIIGNIHLSKAEKPACSKCLSVVKASVISSYSMTTNDTQSVSDQSLSGRLAIRSRP